MLLEKPTKIRYLRIETHFISKEDSLNTAGLNSVKPINIINLYKDLNSTKKWALNYELYENAITVLKNANAVLPIKDLANQKIAYLKWEMQQTIFYLH
jgi:beta-glucosidase-like glycosyl hydrolase